MADRHACNTATNNKNALVGIGETIRVVALLESKFAIDLGKVDIRGRADSAGHIEIERQLNVL